MEEAEALEPEFEESELLLRDKSGREVKSGLLLVMEDGVNDIDVSI